MLEGASLLEPAFDPEMPQEDLDLPEQEFTYLAGSTDRPWSQFLGRWNAMRPEIKRMLAACDPDRPLRVLDLGSCHGFFSLQVAHWHQEADVVGIEGSVGVGNGTAGVLGTSENILQTRAVQTHLKWIKKLGLPNCFVAPEVWDYNRIRDLAAKGKPVCDVMLSLSVVHHLDGVSLEQYSAQGIDRVQGFTNLLAKLLLLSPRHFIELPNPPWLTEVFEAYGTQRGILDAAVKASGMKWQFRGPIYSAEWFGQRDLWILEAEDAMPQVDVQTSPFSKLYRGDDSGAAAHYQDGYTDPRADPCGPLSTDAMLDDYMDGYDAVDEVTLFGERSLQFVDPGFMMLQGPTGPVSTDIGELLNAAPTALLVAHLALREAIGEAERVLRELAVSDLHVAPSAMPRGA